MTSKARILAWVVSVAAVAAAAAWNVQLLADWRRESAAASRATRAADSLEAHTRTTRERALVERLRRDARAQPGVALAIDLDSAHLTLLRDGLVLRRLPVTLGAATSQADAQALGRGAFEVATVLGPKDRWEVPAWLFTERGLPVPDTTAIRGALGVAAVRLSDGPWIYALPTVGPLADSTYTMPGAIRAKAKDLASVTPNVTVGTPVYIF